MMDIYYFFAPPVTAETTHISAARSGYIKAVTLDEKKFEDDFDNEMSRFAEGFKIRNSDTKDFDEFERDLDRCIEECRSDTAYRFEVRSPLYGNLKLTSGYLFHMDRLRKLSMEGEPVFPFLAVDPRRPGIKEALRNENLIGKKGPFYGVKLYPRLGYHPAGLPVQEIFDICIERDLPVTTHCGMSGFPSADFSLDGSGVWKYNDYGNPEHFEPALKKGLRIDFAHMGSCDPDFKWAKTIVAFMGKYKNVYSDLSCYTGKDEIKKIIDLFGNNSIFRERILYGSDFDVMNFTDNKISLEQYCRNFSDLFPEEIKNMRYRNVLKFLNM
jgi:predicted TIM-barrel fold metal-dependent hydrolase